MLLAVIRTSFQPLSGRSRGRIVEVDLAREWNGRSSADELLTSSGLAELLLVAPQKLPKHSDNLFSASNVWSRSEAPEVNRDDGWGGGLAVPSYCAGSNEDFANRTLMPERDREISHLVLCGQNNPRRQSRNRLAQSVSSAAIVHRSQRKSNEPVGKMAAAA